MIKNTYLKKILKNSIFKSITLINKIISKNENYILLHISNKGINFNLQPLYEYLIKNKYNQKYKIICSVESKEFFDEEFKNVKYVNHINAILWYLRSKYVFYTAGQLPIKPSKKQRVIHTNHGITTYKTLGALTKINNGDEFFFTHMIVPSKLYVPIVCREYLCDQLNIVICNEPMTDRILNPKKIYNFSKYKKVLLWVPTFRQSDYLGYDDSSVEDLLPIFNATRYMFLNNILQEKNILLLVKLHPSQSTKKYNEIKFSHLKIMSHDDFVANNMNLYDLMASVDGLIGDYSSTTTQFLLTDKPIAYAIPDYDEYKEKRGFIFENAKDYMPGHLMYDEDDFIKFINEFHNNIDLFKSKREEIKNMIHQYQDCNACERLLEITGINL